MTKEKGSGPKFQRTTEDFTCNNCGSAVTGSGYTNHCPMCLWSRHVDINPGDRLASCGGMMRPIGIEKSGGKFIVVQKCLSCGHTRKNKVLKEDNFDEVIRISKH